MKTIEQEAAELYPIGANPWYEEIDDPINSSEVKDAERAAYIAGATKYDPVAFGEWLVVNYVNTINNTWRTMFSDTTYTTAELFQIYLNREQ